MSDTADHRVIVALDVARLMKPHLHNSGISRYARNIYAGFTRLAAVRAAEFELLLVSSEGSKAPDDAAERFQAATGLAPVGEIIGKNVFVTRLEAGGLDPESLVYFSTYEAFPDWLPATVRRRVVTVHDLFHLERPDIYGADFHNTHLQLLQAALAPNDLVICVSEYTRARVIQFFNHPHENVHTVPLAPEGIFTALADTFVPVAELEDVGRFFVFFAQLDSRKNLKTTVTAIDAAIRSGALGDFRCVTIVSNGKVPEFYKVLEDAGIDAARFVVVSGLGDAELAELYRRAHFLLFASLAEGFGLPIVEAYACGCPVITSSTTSLPEVASTGALFVNPEKAKQIQQAIVTLCGSETLRDRLAENALAVARRFNWGRTIGETWSIVAEGAADIAEIADGGDLEALLAGDGEGERTMLAPARVLRGSALPGLTLPVSRTESVPCTTLFENAENGVHAIEFKHQPAEGRTAFEFVFAVKSLARLKATVFLIASETRPTDNNQIMLVLDLAVGALELAQVSHDQVVHGASSAWLEDGWLLVRVAADFPLPLGKGLSVLIAARPNLGRTTTYDGQEVPALAVSPLWVRDIAAAGGADEDEPAAEARLPHVA